MDDRSRGLSAERVHKQLDASLHRPKTDYVDIYFWHRFDLETPVAEILEALSEEVRAGKVGIIGFTEWTDEQIEAALELGGEATVTVSQQQYSMLWRTPVP